MRASTPTELSKNMSLVETATNLPEKQAYLPEVSV